MGHKYKNKYTSIKTIYKHVKLTLYKNIDYKLYYSIIKRFFEILIRDISDRDHQVYLPNQMGYIYLAEKPHTRAFHVRVDNKATKEKGLRSNAGVDILTKTIGNRMLRQSIQQDIPVGRIIDKINNIDIEGVTNIIERRNKYNNKIRCSRIKLVIKKCYK